MYCRYTSRAGLLHHSSLRLHGSAGDAARYQMTLTSVRTTVTLALTTTVLASVVLITAIAPLATDMYVPAFPLVAHDLDAGATEVQLTLTTFFVGMALGQLVGGPFSDRVGRRRPLLVSLLVLTAA